MKSRFTFVLFAAAGFMLWWFGSTVLEIIFHNRPVGARPLSLPSLIGAVLMAFILASFVMFCLLRLVRAWWFPHLEDDGLLERIESIKPQLQTGAPATDGSLDERPKTGLLPSQDTILGNKKSGDKYSAGVTS